MLKYFCTRQKYCAPRRPVPGRRFLSPKERKGIAMEKKKRVSFGMFLVTIGIVYGDIGTSPLYVMKSILKGNGGIAHVNEDFILGALSLIIWTITLLTTVKYVLIAMRADNNGEGGIFSLYALVKKVAPWLIFPAMIGGAARSSSRSTPPACRSAIISRISIRSIRILRSRRSRTTSSFSIRPGTWRPSTATFSTPSSTRTPSAPRRTGLSA